MLDYPYFVDVRAPGLNPDHPITSGLPQVTITWASPINVDPEALGERRLTPLLTSSPGSWLSTATDVMPRFTEQGLSAFVPTGEVAPRTLAVLLEGRFDSFFAGKESPLLTLELPEADAEAEDEPADQLGVVTGVIDKSTDAARLFVFGSNGFLADQTLRMVGSADGTLYGNSAQMMVNVIDWSLEDQSLLSIRSRGNFNRTLPPLDSDSQALMEYANYALALLGVGVVALVYRRRIRRMRAGHQQWLAGAAA